MADNTDGLAGGGEVLRDAHEVVIVADVLGGPPAREDQAEVLLFADVAEGDVAGEVVALGLLGEVPVRRLVVLDEVVEALLGRGDPALVAEFIEEHAYPAVEVPAPAHLAAVAFVQVSRVQIGLVWPVAAVSRLGGDHHLGEIKGRRKRWRWSGGDGRRQGLRRGAGDSGRERNGCGGSEGRSCSIRNSRGAGQQGGGCGRQYGRGGAGSQREDEQEGQDFFH
ncbi:MAG: hypothetical protein BWY83_02093 [bacterium ADurb.Bin478]|nr:MAG: hypothetical protein BWY83_02093 [bacterium ADurb.Bin478]